MANTVEVSKEPGLNSSVLGIWDGETKKYGRTFHCKKELLGAM
ncbi:hypothetical protein [Flagellimonas chongwuensis]|nr:hypothetical protein [Allomuricauda chongwuensis]